MIDFTPEPAVVGLRERVRAFVRDSCTLTGACAIAARFDSHVVHRGPRRCADPDEPQPMPLNDGGRAGDDAAWR
jgi:hypothetical protein